MWYFCIHAYAPMCMCTYVCAHSLACMCLCRFVYVCECVSVVMTVNVATRFIVTRSNLLCVAVHVTLRYNDSERAARAVVIFVSLHRKREITQPALNSRNGWQLMQSKCTSAQTAERDNVIWVGWIQFKLILPRWLIAARLLNLSIKVNYVVLSIFSDVRASLICRSTARKYATWIR